MTTFEIITIIGAICGVIMVVGGMLLLLKGVITLREKNSEDALTVEFKNLMKVTTHYPALGLFVIGLIFIVVTFYVSKPPEAKPFKISGQVHAADPNLVTVVVTAPYTWVGKAFTDGKILATITPKIDYYEVRITSPGYEEKKISVETEKCKSDTVQIGEISLGERVAQMPPLNPSNIVPVDTNLPPLAESGKY